MFIEKKVKFNLKLKPELKFERESTLMCMTSRRQTGDNGGTEKNNYKLHIPRSLKGFTQIFTFGILNKATHKYYRC